MDLKKRIIDAGLIFKITNISKQVFNQWIEKSKKVYGLSENLYMDIKYNEIVDIFIDHLEKASSSLINQELSTNKTQRWSYGYICGFIQGGIDVEWVNEYIIKQCKEYEEIIMLKAISLYLNWDKSALNTIYSISKYFLDQRMLPPKIIEEKIPNIISILKYHDNEQHQKKDFERNLVDYLSNEYIMKYSQLLNKKSVICCPDITDFLDIEDLQAILPEGVFY